MKQILPLACLALALSSCSKSSAAPDPKATLIGLWKLSSTTTVTAFKDGRPSTTTTSPHSADLSTVQFWEDAAEYRTRGLVQYSGWYAFDGKTITYRGAYPPTHTVLTLTNNSLIMVDSSESATTRAEHTSSYTR